MSASDPITRLNAALEARYLIERELGQGGMATVYLADDLRHGRKVALKVLKSEVAEGIGPERFVREVRITAGLRHPHVLPLFDSGEAGGFLFYVMPFFEGETLRERLSREGELPVDEVASLLRDVVEALAAAHAEGIVHRDIKPANILLSGGHAAVADFGIARAASDAKSQDHLTTVGSSLGTPKYMAPEQAAGDEVVDHRADVYSLGAVAYEMLTGRPPFEATGHRQLLMAHITQDPDPIREQRSAVPEPLADAVMKCLAKRAADRWQRVDDLLPYLDAAMRPAAGPVAPADTRGVAPTLVIALATMLVVVGGWWTMSRPSVESGFGGASLVVGPESVVRIGLPAPGNESGDAELDYLASRLDREMRRAIAQYAPEAVIQSRVVDAGATHVIQTSYGRDPTGLHVSQEVLDGSSGEVIRVLDPISGPLASVDSLITGAGNAAAVVAMSLTFWEGESFMLAEWPLPKDPLAMRYQHAGGAAFFEGRNSDAVDWMFQAMEVEPTWTVPYTNIVGALNNSGRQDEWTPEIDSVFQTLIPDMSEDQQLYWTWLTGATRDDQIEAGEIRFRRHGGIFNIGYGLAFRALPRNRVGLAREAMDAQDFEHKLIRDWWPAWGLDAQVYHIEGRYEEEFRRAGEALDRLPGDPQLHLAQLRAVLAQGAYEEAERRYGELMDLPGDRHVLWHVLIAGALEARAHGAPAMSEAMFTLLPDWAAANGLGPLDRMEGLYGAGRYEEVVSTMAGNSASDGRWVGDEGVPPQDRALAAAHLIMSLEALGRDDEVSRFEPTVFQFEGGTRSIGRRWAAVVEANRGNSAEAVRLLRDALEDGVDYYSFGALPDVNLFLHLRPELAALEQLPAYRELVSPR